MAVAGGPNIVEDGLVLALDAANVKSYPGSGTVWNDLASETTGSLVNSPTFNSNYAGVLEFDGLDSYVELGDIDSSNVLSLYNTDFTVHIWFNPSGSGDSYQRVIDKSNGSSMANGWGITATQSTPTSKQLAFYINTGNPVLRNDEYNFGEWYSIVFTREGNVMKMYNNGTLKDTDNNATPIPSTTTGCRIGAWPADTARCFGGSIGAIWIYHKALTASEVLQNYNATKGRFGL